MGRCDKKWIQNIFVALNFVIKTLEKFELDFPRVEKTKEYEMNHLDVWTSTKLN
jgi:hypothetical protein